MLVFVDSAQLEVLILDCQKPVERMILDKKSSCRRQTRSMFLQLSYCVAHFVMKFIRHTD